jgi:hypothetical protein
MELRRSVSKMSADDQLWMQVKSDDADLKTDNEVVAA